MSYITTRSKILLLVSLIALLLVACGGGNAAAPTATSAPSSGSGSSSSGGNAQPTTAAEVKPTEKPAEPTAATVDEPTTLVSILDDKDIKSFRVKISLKGEGAAFEGEETTSFDVITEQTRDPEASHISIAAGGETIEAIQIEDKSWAKFGDSWVANSSGEDMDFTKGLTPFDAEDIQDIKKLKKVGSEKVNGFDTIHYTFDKTTLATIMKPEDMEDIEKVDKAEGDFYITPEGLLIKWNMVLSGKGVNSDNEDLEGTLTMNYEVYDVNANITIEPPPEPSAVDNLGFDLKTPEGATRTFMMEGLASYSAPTLSVADAAAFYKKELEAAGFTAQDDYMVETEESALLSYTNDKMDVTVSITKKDAGSEITVSTTKKSE